MGIYILAILLVLLWLYDRSKKTEPRPKEEVFDNRTPEERRIDEYWTDHRYSVDLRCFVKIRPSGTVVVSIPYADWDAGIQDDTGQIVTPTCLMDKDHYLLYEECGFDWLYYEYRLSGEMPDFRP